mmetsp:Transcript_5897/g.5054  ORF Transcript_5897/g.5054 Transcript_5897/m.5054 type:complete len:119 (+) Transcript_5897:282-638(+)
MINEQRVDRLSIASQSVIRPKSSSKKNLVRRKKKYLTSKTRITSTIKKKKRNKDLLSIDYKKNSVPSTTIKIAQIHQNQIPESILHRKAESMLKDEFLLEDFDPNQWRYSQTFRALKK